MADLYAEITPLRTVPVDISQSRPADFRGIVKVSSLPIDSSEYNLNARLMMLDGHGCYVPSDYVSLSNQKKRAFLTKVRTEVIAQCKKITAKRKNVEENSAVLVQ